jgi:hypothetical protein
MNNDLTINTINDFNRTLETFRSNDPAEIDKMMVALRSIIDPAVRVRVSAHLLQRVEAISAFILNNNPFIHQDYLSSRNFCYAIEKVQGRYEELSRLREQLANPSLLQRMWNTGARVFRHLSGAAPEQRSQPVPLRDREIDLEVPLPIPYRIYVITPAQARQLQAQLLARLETMLKTVPESVIKKAHDFNVYVNAVRNYPRRKGITPGLEETFREMFEELIKAIQDHQLNQPQCEALVVAYPSLNPFFNRR